MSHFLSAALKLGRAQTHFQFIAATLSDLRTETRTEQLDPDTGGVSLLYAEEIPVPSQFPLAFGDAIHNLRSSLDHLIWGRTQADGGGVGTWTQFPILLVDDWEVNGAWRARKSLEGLSPRHREMVKTIQPYQRGNDAASHPLAVLSSLDNDDKHREIHLLYTDLILESFDAAAVEDCKILAIKPSAEVTLNAGAEVGRVEVRVTGPKPAIQVEAQFSAGISLPDRRDIVELWGELSDCVMSVALKLSNGEIARLALGHGLPPPEK